ncbi:MAG: ABC transporter ATP-binding protein [Candidatus Pacebacteria bacterium]|nr:ABC transporter ATP-binding protein [Candidatus Paceibacterota bacterium]
MKVIVRLYQSIFKYPRNFIVYFVLFTVGVLLSSTQPFFVKWVTAAVQSGSYDQAFWILVWFGVALVVGNCIIALSYYIGDQGMTRISIDLQGAILKHLHDLDFAYHTNKSSGKLIGIMRRGDEAYFGFYHLINREIYATVLVFVLMLWTFATLRSSYMIFGVVVSVVSVVISLFLVKLNIKYRKKFSVTDDEVSGVRVDNLVNFDTVKYFAQEEYEQHRFGTLLTRWYDDLVNYFQTFRYFDIIVGNLSLLSLVVVMVLAVMDVRSQTLSLPDFLLVSSFSLFLFPRLVSILFTLRELAKRYDDFEKYLGLLDEEIKVVDPKHAEEVKNLRGSVAFRNVSFSYHANEDVLSDFSLEIKPGESVALVGYSGAGKTTITKLIMRFFDPTAGSITVDDVDITHMKKSYLRTLVGIVPQDPIMFNNTIAFNVRYARPDANDAEVDHVLRLAKLDDFIKKLPEKDKTIVGERGIKLSGGQRQRLAIARLLLEQPKIILFDEATSSLDSESERSIQQAFWSIAKDPKNPRTSIIIAHRLSTIMRADRIVVLDKGKIAEVGTHESLVKKEGGIYHKLWQLQQDGFIGEEKEETSSLNNSSLE